VNPATSRWRARAEEQALAIRHIQQKTISIAVQQPSMRADDRNSRLNRSEVMLHAIERDDNDRSATLDYLPP